MGSKGSLNVMLNFIRESSIAVDAGGSQVRFARFSACRIREKAVVAFDSREKFSSHLWTSQQTIRILSLCSEVILDELSHASNINEKK